MNNITSTFGEMGAAYSILPHMCLIFYYILKKANVINITVFIAGIVMMFSLGNRGSIGCLAVFIVLTLLFIYRKAHPLALAAVIIGFIIVIATPLFDIIFEWMYDFAVDNGLSTRIFDKFTEGELSDDSGRSAIQSIIKSAIWESPFFGKGIMGDRVLIGGYAHNIVLELMCDFGIILGFGLFGAILIIFIKAVLVNKKLKRA